MKSVLIKQKKVVNKSNKMKNFLLTHIDNHGSHATVGGFVAGLFAAVDAPHLVSVFIYAAVGAAVSFLVSRFMAWCFKKH